jgi:hypothetical protein
MVDYNMEPMRALLEWAKKNGEKCNWKIDGSQNPYLHSLPRSEYQIMNWLARKLEREVSHVPC